MDIEYGKSLREPYLYRNGLRVVCVLQLQEEDPFEQKICACRDEDSDQ